MHYRIYSNTEPRHLVATVWGLELAEHTVDQLLTEFDGVDFTLEPFIPSETDYLVIWEDSSFSL
jgi:hypothetical protein